MTKQYFDIAVVIPLEEELQSFLKVFPTKSDLCTQTEFRFAVESGNSDLNILVVQQEEMGKGYASRATARTLAEFDIGLVVCLGIAGSLSSDLSFENCRPSLSFNRLDTAYQPHGRSRSTIIVF
jgi:nucleoside phosphorylase